MPDLASRKLARTSWVLLPMDETMPIPVTTTRLILPWPSLRLVIGGASSAAGCRLILAEQTDLEVDRLINHGAVRRQKAVGDAEHQLRAHHALEVDAVNDLLHRREHLAGKFKFAETERAAFAGRAEPAEEKPDHLPERVKAEATRHHRIALEVAEEEPEVRLDIEFGTHHALAVLAARFRNLGNAIEHQHRRQRQLR